MGTRTETHHAQIAAILEAWGMPKGHAARTAEVMTWADLRGIASHGISMLLNYDVLRAKRKVAFAADPTILRETSVSALVDGGGGLGYVPARFPTELAVKKAKTAGIGVVGVRNSMHFGPAGST